jgi:rfaE bifunctional protein nucleotidyltransferase chain/domain
MLKARMNMKKKTIALNKIISIRVRMRRNKKKVVFTNGCFDILHSGHVRYLQKAKSFGDILIVGLNSDASIRRIKGPSRPINSQKDRATVLCALACVDYVVIFSAKTPQRLIEAIKPDVLVKGGDWALNDIVGKDILDEYGGAVRRVRLVKGRSTTNVIDKIRNA